MVGTTNFGETTAEVHVTERVAGSDAFAFSGLTAGREYHARVTAYNRAGYGPVSAEVAAVPKTQASAPNKVSVAVGSGTSLIARWSPPSDDGGAKIQGYEVEWYSEPGTPETQVVTLSASDGVTEVQTVTTGADELGLHGHFTLPMGGETTDPIPVDAPPMDS